MNQPEKHCTTEVEVVLPAASARAPGRLQELRKRFELPPQLSLGSAPRARVPGLSVFSAAKSVSLCDLTQGSTEQDSWRSSNGIAGARRNGAKESAAKQPTLGQAPGRSADVVPSAEVPAEGESCEHSSKPVGLRSRDAATGVRPVNPSYRSSWACAGRGSMDQTLAASQLPILLERQPEGSATGKGDAESKPARGAVALTSLLFEKKQAAPARQAPGRGPGTVSAANNAAGLVHREGAERLPETENRRICTTGHASSRPASVEPAGVMPDGQQPAIESQKRSKWTPKPVTVTACQQPSSVTAATYHAADKKPPRAPRPAAVLVHQAHAEATSGDVSHSDGKRTQLWSVAAPRPKSSLVATALVRDGQRTSPVPEESNVSSEAAAANGLKQGLAVLAPVSAPLSAAPPPPPPPLHPPPPPKPPRTFEHDVCAAAELTAAQPNAASAAVFTAATSGGAVDRLPADKGRQASDDDDENAYEDIVFDPTPAPQRQGKDDRVCLPPPLPERVVAARSRAGSDGGSSTVRPLSMSNEASEGSPARSSAPLLLRSNRVAVGSDASNPRRPMFKNGKDAALAKNKGLSQLVALGMKRYASEECLSTAVRADKADGNGRGFRTGIRWPAIDEFGYAVPETNGKVEDSQVRDRRLKGQGLRAKSGTEERSGMLRAASHNDVSKAGLSEASVPLRNAAASDLERIRGKLNGAFAILGRRQGRNRSRTSSFEEDALLEQGAEDDGEYAKQRRAAVKNKEQSPDRSSSSGDKVPDGSRSRWQSDVPDQELLQKRLKHCNSVKQYSVYASANKVREFAGKAYPQLYQYAVIVSLRKNGETNQYEPYVLFKFPPRVDLEATGVPQFCFPDAQVWHKVTEYKSETFTFVLTECTGLRQYGYCRRFLPPSKANVPRIPEVVCLVSPLSAFKFYLQVLDEIERRRRFSTAEEFLQAAYGKPLPKAGKSVSVRAMDDSTEETELVTFSRAEDARIDGISYELLLRTLTPKQIVICFGAILLERKIVFCAEKLSTLSSCVNALVSLVYPFAWQHTFVPVLPPLMIEVACSPTPFIVGVLSNNLSRLTSLEMDEVLVVNLDSQKFIITVGDEADILPKPLQKALCLALDLARTESKWRDMVVSETFLRFFFETVGNMNDFFDETEDGERIFEKERLVAEASNNGRTILVEFLEWFTETQMFEVYITERLSDPQAKRTTYDEKFLEWTKESTLLSTEADHAPVQKFFKNIRARIRI